MFIFTCGDSLSMLQKNSKLLLLLRYAGILECYSLELWVLRNWPVARQHEAEAGVGLSRRAEGLQAAEGLHNGVNGGARGGGIWGKK